jgi:hypothetical protein
MSGNTYVTVVVVYASSPLIYASFPVTRLNMQRFAKSSHLWPLSVFKHSPDELGFQIFTVLSELQLASSPSMDQSMP